MGCCISTGKKPQETDPSKSQTNKDRDPPSPPSVEEETVKEVLVHSVSETPISKQLPLEIETEIRTQTLVPANTNLQDPKPQIRDEDKTPELSQASEICSFSTATTATDNIGDDEAMSQPQRASRSPGTARGRRPYGGGAGRERVPRSPARKPEQSPQGKRLGPRMVQGRVAGHVGPTRRNVGPPASAVRRGDSQEGALRRSRSPATRTAGFSEKSGGAVARKSPVKSKGIAGDSRSTDVDTVRTENGSMVKKEESNTIGSAGTETLDNPLVSLECFIFL